MRRPSQYFRAGVGAIITDDQRRVLALERSDIPKAWQLPQGGLEEGEEPSMAVLREVKEETGIRPEDLELSASYPEPLVYELPPEARSAKTGRGQVQYWFLFRFKGDKSALTLDGSREFTKWRWMSFDDLLDAVVEFRTQVYRRLKKHFAAHL